MCNFFQIPVGPIMLRGWTILFAENKIERFECCSTNCLLCMVSYSVSRKKVSCSVLLLQCLCASQVHAQNTTIVPSESVIEYC